MEATLRHPRFFSIFPFGGRGPGTSFNWQGHKVSAPAPRWLWFLPVWSARTWNERQAHVSQAEAFNFWLCDTGWETYPTSQLLAWTRASFTADISPSAKSNQTPLSLTAIPEDCIYNQSKAPEPVPALRTCQSVWWGGEGPYETHLLCFAGQEPILICEPGITLGKAQELF